MPQKIEMSRYKVSRNRNKTVSQTSLESTKMAEKYNEMADSVEDSMAPNLNDREEMKTSS